MNNVRLVKAGVEDAELVHKLQCEAFMPLYVLYRDHDTSPALDTVSRVVEKIVDSDFFVIYFCNYPVGGVRLRRFDKDGTMEVNISPLFLIPEYWDKVIGSVVMNILFDSYQDVDKWTLATIEEDDRNCHFYEKLGFVRTGSRKEINKKMTIIGYEKRC